MDIITGQGLARALAGAEIVIDAATGSSPEQATATEFFTTSARNLQETGAKAGVKQIIVVSIIGIDRFTAGYMAAKVAHENALLSGPIPVSILRAAQFHEFVQQLVDWGTQGDVSYVSNMRSQLVAARTVAQELVKMATNPIALPASGPSKETPFLEVAGPRAEDLIDVAVKLVATRRVPLRIERVNNTSDPDHALYEAGALLPGPQAILAGPTFDEWLASAAEGRERFAA